MKNYFTFLFSLISITCLGTPTIDTFRIDKKENTFFFLSKKPTIHFLCLITKTQRESLYLEKFNLLYNKKEIQNIENLHINLIFFEDINDIDNTIGLDAYFSENETKYVVNDFEVLFQNFDYDKLSIHQKRQEISKYFIIKTIRIPDLVKVKIADVFCPDLLAENIPQYRNYISQFFNPSYSEKEEIDFLKDSLKLYKTQLDSLQKKIELQNVRLQKVESYFSSKTSSSSPIEKEEKKSKEKNNVIIKENE